MQGFYNIIKPTGANSTKMVSIVKRTTKCKSGHLGTLDPMAAGVLPIAVGKATKLFDWFLNKDKKYFAIGNFGVLTDTLDSEGTILQKQTVNIEKTQIDDILNEFCGIINQIPPNYSSISINGKRAYDLARAGQQIDMPTRKVNIFSIKCVEQVASNMFAFEIHCSAGTYIRSLILDIAKRLNTIATTVCIIRTQSGPFNNSNSCTIEEVQNKTAKLIPVEDVLNYAKINVDDQASKMLLNGMNTKLQYPDNIYLCYNKDIIIGVVEVKNNYAKISINLWENTND